MELAVLGFWNAFREPEPAVPLGFPNTRKDGSLKNSKNRPKHCFRPTSTAPSLLPCKQTNGALQESKSNNGQAQTRRIE